MLQDEHGQSMLHFAAARSHGRNALFQLLQETNINIGYRDELYRSARDISIQANIPENTNEIDKYVLFIACKGDTDKLVELLLNGYDHITDIIDEDDVPIIEAVSSKDQQDTMAFLQSILTFEVSLLRVTDKLFMCLFTCRKNGNVSITPSGKAWSTTFRHSWRTKTILAAANCLRLEKIATDGVRST